MVTNEGGLQNETKARSEELFAIADKKVICKTMLLKLTHKK